MTKDEKKELFLLIVQSWFEDYSKKINSENCIGFYNYFIDCLEFEIQFSPEHKNGFNNFLYIIVDLLCNFPSYKRDGIEKRANVKTLVLSHVDGIESDNLDDFFKKLKDLFFMFRDEYII